MRINAILRDIVNHTIALLRLTIRPRVKGIYQGLSNLASLIRIESHNHFLILYYVYYYRILEIITRYPINKGK